MGDLMGFLGGAFALYFLYVLLIRSVRQDVRQARRTFRRR